MISTKSTTLNDVYLTTRRRNSSITVSFRTPSGINTRVAITGNRTQFESWLRTALNTDWWQHLECLSDWNEWTIVWRALVGIHVAGKKVRQVIRVFRIMGNIGNGNNDV